MEVFFRPHHRVTPPALSWVEHGWTYLYRTGDFRACTAALEMKMKNGHRFNACANLPTLQRFVFAPSQGKIQADRVNLCICVCVCVYCVCGKDVNVVIIYHTVFKLPLVHEICVGFHLHRPIEKRSTTNGPMSRKAN